MTNLPQSFSKLLEQYVFTTANQVIDLATREQQAILVKLIIDIPTDVPPAGSHPSPVLGSPNEVSQPVLASANRLIHDLWLTKLFQRQIERNEASIAQIEQAIETTQQGFQARVNKFRSEAAQANLEMCHSRMLKRYQNYLVSLQTIQRTNRDRLSRLTSS